MSDRLFYILSIIFSNSLNNGKYYVCNQITVIVIISVRKSQLNYFIGTLKPYNPSNNRFITNHSARIDGYLVAPFSQIR